MSERGLPITALYEVPRTQSDMTTDGYEIVQDQKTVEKRVTKIFSFLETEEITDLFQPEETSPIVDSGEKRSDANILQNSEQPPKTAEETRKQTNSNAPEIFKETSMNDTNLRLKTEGNNGGDSGTKNRSYLKSLSFSSEDNEDSNDKKQVTEESDNFPFIEECKDSSKEIPEKNDLKVTTMPHNGTSIDPSNKTNENSELKIATPPHNGTDIGASVTPPKTKVLPAIARTRPKVLPKPMMPLPDKKSFTQLIKRYENVMNSVDTPIQNPVPFPVDFRSDPPSRNTTSF